MSRSEKRTDAIDQTRQRVWERSGPYCEECEANEGNQLAHRIAQTKANLSKYGAEVIHHPMNLRWVCSLECNARAAIGKSKVREMDAIAAEIKAEIEKERQ